MRRTGPAVVCLALVLLVSLRAQIEPGAVHGVVVDTSGGVLPGVTVTAAARGIVSRSTVTDSGGEFRIPGLPPGSYAITAALDGFSTYTGLVAIVSGRTERLTLTMRVGALEEAIVVSGSVPVVDAMAVQTTVLSRSVLEGRGERTRFNTEAYQRIDDSPFRRVSDTPLSTFSIDVDTASYSNVRRFLNEGTLPPRDAVRIEELINYFTYEYEEPGRSAPFAVTTAVDACPWNPRHRLALIGLQARRLDSAATPPRNLVFLIDVSGSMQAANKLPLVKGSLAMLARNLSSRDRVAIVVYAGAAGLVLPPTPGHDTTKILDAIGRLAAGGSTNGAQGIALAYATAREQFIPGGVNRVVLATDGDFNVGVTSHGELSRMVEENRASGIALSVLGFGMQNFKDSTMEMLADRGNGNYAYIDTLAEARKVLVDEAGGTLVTVARDVKLQVEFNPRLVAAYRLIGYENRILRDEDFTDDTKDAGDMGAGHSVTALYEIVPVGEEVDTPRVPALRYQTAPRLSRRAGRDEVMTINLRYKQPDGDRSTAMNARVTWDGAPHAALGFASAIAEFGMLLRDSEHKGAASYAAARARAKKYRGDDPHGHRTAFLALVESAEQLARHAATH